MQSQMSMRAPSLPLAPLTSRQRPDLTCLNWKAPVCTSGVMVQDWSTGPSQLWSSTCVPFAVPPPTTSRHLPLFAFIAIFQLLPTARMLNFCGSPSQLDSCCRAVPLFCEPLEMSIDFVCADIGEMR